MSKPAYGFKGTPSGEIFTLLCEAANLPEGNVKSLSISFETNSMMVMTASLICQEDKIAEALEKQQIRSFERKTELLDNKLNGVEEPLRPQTPEEAFRAAITKSKKHWLTTVGAPMVPAATLPNLIIKGGPP